MSQSTQGRPSRSTSAMVFNSLRRQTMPAPGVFRPVVLTVPRSQERPGENTNPTGDDMEYAWNDEQSKHGASDGIHTPETPVPQAGPAPHWLPLTPEVHSREPQWWGRQRRRPSWEAETSSTGSATPISQAAEVEESEEEETAASPTDRPRTHVSLLGEPLQLVPPPSGASVR